MWIMRASLVDLFCLSETISFLPKVLRSEIHQLQQLSILHEKDTKFYDIVPLYCLIIYLKKTEKSRQKC